MPQAVEGLLHRQVAGVEHALSAALDMRKLNQAAGGLLAGPAGRAATAAPTTKRQVSSCCTGFGCCHGLPSLLHREGNAARRRSWHGTAANIF